MPYTKSGTLAIAYRFLHALPQLATAIDKSAPFKAGSRQRAKALPIRIACLRKRAAQAKIWYTECHRLKLIFREGRP